MPHKHDKPAKMPTSVKVGPMTYEVVTDAAEILRQEGAEAIYGCCDKSNVRIYISPVPAVGRQKQTMVHELTHAIWDEAKLSTEKELDEEKVVTGISSALLSVLLDNPKLLNWLWFG